jgi:hypothetical protein
MVAGGMAGTAFVVLRIISRSSPVLASALWVGGLIGLAWGGQAGYVLGAKIDQAFPRSRCCAWAREKTPEAPHHHYHLAMMMDGALMQNPRGLQAKADAVWSNLLGGSFENRVHFCQQDRGGRKAQGAVMIHRPSSKATGHDRIDQEQKFNKQREEAIYAASYLAKNHTKDDRLPPRTRRFGASEL